MKNIILAGGNTQITNFKERLVKELQAKDSIFNDNPIEFTDSILPETANYK